MFDKGDRSLEYLIEETQTFKSAVSSIKHSKLLSPLSNIQDSCLLYQTFKPAVSSIEETAGLNV
jgi:hypothetical protein